MRQEQAANDRIVTLGHIAGSHGVKGWIQVYSHTEPREAILEYAPWLLGTDQRPVRPLEGARLGKKVIARLEGINDREQAESVAGLEIGIERSQLPDPGGDRYYWADLIGLKVVLENGETLGTIKEMMATGANDVMVVAGPPERLIPFIKGQTVLQVDLNKAEVCVDWDVEF
jgi:16S rRNA processing protein RimM